jgi:hypothetical protein|tara:strand:- start:49264 stop:49545 length:282 start_codon:yes stop_codon:yes gene_type:complete
VYTADTTLPLTTSRDASSRSSVTNHTLSAMAMDTGTTTAPTARAIIHLGARSKISPAPARSRGRDGMVASRDDASTNARDGWMDGVGWAQRDS